MNLSEELLERIEKSTTLDFIDELKVKEDYLKESVYVTSLYDGVSILSCYSTYKLMKESLESKMKEDELYIATCYKVYKYIEEISDFLIKYKSQIKQYVKNKTIDTFTLEGNNSEESELIRFDYKKLCNNEGLASLYSIKKALWERILNSLEKIRETEIILENLKGAFDEEYLEDIDEIQEEMLKNYSKLDYDKLDMLAQKKTVFSDKEKILLKVEICYDRQKHILDYVNPTFYSVFIGRNFYYGHYYDYIGISSVYRSELKERFKDVNK